MNDRLRVPVEDHYVEAIGRATFVFAVLEWNAVWCLERLRPGCIDKMAEKTAGGIAKALSNAASNHSDVAVRAALRRPADEFARLVEERNQLIHGRPCAPDGITSRLSSRDKVWTAEMIDGIADEFARCSESLNSILHGVLGPLP